MSNRYSSFPDALDELKKLTEVQEMTVTQKQKVARCTELSLKANLTPSEEIELQKLMQELKGFRLDSSDWNKVVETLMNTQKYIKENILGEVGDLVDAWEKYINNMITTKEQEVTTTVTQAKEEINTLKVSTMEELSQKVSDIVSNGKVGLDFFKGQIVLKSNSTSVIINIPEYNRTTDFLTVYVNGALITEGVNYTIGNDNFSIKSIGGDWTTGTVFDFVVLKKTIVKLEHYDVGLFEDGTIRKEKLTVDLQNKIGKVDEIERNLTKFTTDTNSSLEQVMKDVGNIKDTVTTPVELQGKDLVTRVNEVFTSVSNGKSKIAGAITDKGVPTSADATFDVMAENIGSIKRMTPGKKYLLMLEDLEKPSYRLNNFLYGNDKYLLVIYDFTSIGEDHTHFRYYDKDKLVLKTQTPTTGSSMAIFGNIDSGKFGYYGVSEKYFYIYDINTLTQVKRIDVGVFNKLFYIDSQKSYYAVRSHDIIKYDLDGNEVKKISKFLNPTWVAYTDKYIYVRVYSTTTTLIFDADTLDLISEVPNVSLNHSFSYTDKYIFQTSNSADYELILYNPETLKQVKTIDLHRDGDICNIIGVKKTEGVVYVQRRTKIVEVNLETGAIMSNIPASNTYGTTFVNVFNPEDFLIDDYLIYTNDMTIIRMFV